MSAKDRVNQKLAAAESLRLNGEFDDARKILETLNTDPDRHALGLTTAGELPRRLQSAFMKLASLKTQEYGYASFYAWNITYDTQVELHLRWPNKTRWTYAQCPES